MRRYSIFWSFWIAISFLYTKLFFTNARLIRLPFDIRNKKYIKIGNSFTTGFGCRLEAYPVDNYSNTLFIGHNVEINDYVHIAAGEKIVIGDNVLIASKVFISDLNHGIYKGDSQDNPLSPPSKRMLSTSPVIIEDNVWIGEGVCIMPGVSIGKGSIIGALSVVTKNIPDFCIAVGSPASVIKKFDFISQKWVLVK
jgi:lipopolysaccharide O-acetyltransferase